MYLLLVQLYWVLAESAECNRDRRPGAKLFDPREGFTHGKGIYHNIGGLGSARTSPLHRGLRFRMPDWVYGCIGGLLKIDIPRSGGPQSR